MMSFVYPAYVSMSERAKATKDMSNLRQIAIATQTYLNDSDGILFSPGTSWSFQLNPKYFSAWRGFESPFDRRASSEAGNASTPISCGVNPNIYSGTVAISVTKITKPTAFILFAPAQAAGTTVSFQGPATSAVPAVTVLGVGSNTATSNPGGNATAGTQNNRAKINALFADWHVETMAWSGTGLAFTNTTDPGNDPDAPYRWSPQGP
jgi:prepilin-type processing-associated H-X9-DG protein